ncbi:hypothetical protein [Paenibacillus sp. RC84]|uniref:hypothetical protein n=1 Tax=Paenibacillus sp. RC84 TaxID=3156252 RepID=UPI0035162B88
MKFFKSVSAFALTTALMVSLSTAALAQSPEITKESNIQFQSSSFTKPTKISDSEKQQLLLNSVPAVPYEAKATESSVSIQANVNISYQFSNLAQDETIDTINAFTITSTKTVPLTLVQYTGFLGTTDVGYALIDQYGRFVGQIQRVKGDYKGTNITIGFPDTPPGTYNIRIINYGSNGLDGNGYTRN